MAYYHWYLDSGECDKSEDIGPYAVFYKYGSAHQRHGAINHDATMRSLAMKQSTIAALLYDSLTAFTKLQRLISNRKDYIHLFLQQWFTV